MIIGAAQVSQRPPADEHLPAPTDPIDLMAAATRAAAESAGTDEPDAVLRTIDSIGVIGRLWRYRNRPR
ncbi:MAG: hypothetical protein R2695_08070 [Acidimicrobiales bacterium]